MNAKRIEERLGDIIMMEGETRTILYDNLKSEKKGTFHPITWALLLAVGSGTAAVIYAEWYLLTNPGIFLKLMGIALALGYLSYLLYFGYQYYRSRGDLTRSAALTPRELRVENSNGVRLIQMDEVILSMSYASASNLCILVVSERDHAVITCSSENLFMRRGRERINAFYAINRELMHRSPWHINYVKARKYRKKNPIRIPVFLFEVEFDTPRFRNFVAQLRKQRC